jgi:hypothetical protein
MSSPERWGGQEKHADRIDPNLIQKFPKPDCFSECKEIECTYHDYLSNPENGAVETTLKPLIQKTNNPLSMKIVSGYIIPLLQQPLALRDTFGKNRDARSAFKIGFKEGTDEKKAMDQQRVRTTTLSSVNTIIYLLKLQRPDLSSQLKEKVDSLLSSYKLPEIGSEDFSQKYNDMSFNAKLNFTHAISVELFNIARTILDIK